VLISLHLDHQIPLHAAGARRVRQDVKLCALAVLATLPAAAAGFDAANAGAVLKAVESRYNRPRTMQMAFEQSLTGGARMSRAESGVLFLAKPGKMLWRYNEPAGKVFLVDGKTVWFYTPNTGRVERSPVRQSDDMRAPLAFLLGELDFAKFFNEFRTKPEGTDGQAIRITAAPKSKRAPYTEVQFVVNQAYDITLLEVAGEDGSRMRFRFSGLTANPKLDPKLFQFVAPAGAQVVEAAGEADGNEAGGAGKP
jgi:outer membrane lipoprotein carrier protein